MVLLKNWIQGPLTKKAPQYGLKSGKVFDARSECRGPRAKSNWAMIRGMVEQLYVLASDPRMPSKDNLWGTEPASSPEEARNRFREHIKSWHNSSGSNNWYFRRMEEDRARRLRDDDFDVELC
jgi:hypothetical protein